MQIKTAKVSDAAVISELAQEVWPATYRGIIPEPQINLMLAQFYTIPAIASQMAAGDTFLILYQDDIAKGFASFSPQTEQIYKLQKLYVHQSLQRKGAGRLLITSVEKACKNLGATQLILNVNRNNQARFFYEKSGYAIVETVDIPYHQYVLNDYVMAKFIE